MSDYPYGDLFDPNKLARTNDPKESKEAAEKIIPQLSELRKMVLDLVKKHPGSIARELTTAAKHRDERKVNRRLSELETMGLIYRGSSRTCSVTKRQCATWWPK